MKDSWWRSISIILFVVMFCFAVHRLYFDLTNKMYDVRKLTFDVDVPTKTYIVDANGKFNKVCDSVGYGISYTTQYKNSQKQSDSITYDLNVSPSQNSLDGTWVLCVSKETGKPSPVYIEPFVIVSPISLENN